MTTKQAKIKCPHCGKAITVRQLDKSALATVSKAMDDAWVAVEDAFKKVFGK